MRLWQILVAVTLVMVSLVLMRPLLPIDETRYLAVAWEMHLSGDPVHLTKNFALYTHKTPLLFALMNVVWLLTGVSEFAARLVGPACAVGMVAGTWALARRFWPDQPQIARDAGLILAGFSVFLIYGSATMFDALLGLAVLAGIAALWRIGQGGQGVRPWLAFGLALAFGIYAKGPVIFVHLFPALLIMPYWAPRPPKGVQIAKGTGLALLVALAAVAVWLVPALISGTPEYRMELLWTQSAARVAGGMAHDRPYWFLPVLLPIILFPFGWSWRLWPLRKAWAMGGVTRLLLIWAGATLALFSLISGKQVHYLLPAFPAMALFFAWALAQTSRSKGGSATPFALLGLALVALAIGFGQVGLGKDAVDLLPLWPVAVYGAGCLLLALLVWQLPLLSGHLLAGVGVALGLHAVIASTSLFRAYDGSDMAATLAARASDGLATTEASYHAQINFRARLTEAVAQPATALDWAAWAQAHPKGLIFGQTDESPLTAAPQGIFRYMGQEWALWPASAALTFQE